MRRASEPKKERDKAAAMGSRKMKNTRHGRARPEDKIQCRTTIRSGRRRLESARENQTEVRKKRKRKGEKPCSESGRERECATKASLGLTLTYCARAERLWRGEIFVGYVSSSSPLSPGQRHCAGATIRKRPT